MTLSGPLGASLFLTAYPAVFKSLLGGEKNDGANMLIFIGN